jgi:dTDP-4-amino-4,6-dideoxygalactose transaminase
LGDGGSIATNDKELAAKLRLLRNYGSTKKYIHKILGTNSRLDPLQAAVLNVKLDLLDDWNRKRFKAACLYAERLKKVTAIKIPLFDQGETARHVFHLFVIQCKDRDKLASYLDSNGIQCGIHYPVPLHLHEAFKGLGYKRGNFPVAEMLSDRILSLPMFPGITQKQICDVVDTIVKFYEQ